MPQFKQTTDTYARSEGYTVSDVYKMSSSDCWQESFTKTKYNV